MTSASFTPIERAMTQPPILDPAADASIAATAQDRDTAGALVGLATRMMEWRRRAKQARDFRGFGQRQLRDLGLNHFDQW